MEKYTTKYCKTCDNIVKAEIHNSKPVNHILHFLLSIFTAGIWVIIWLAAIFDNIFGKKTYCSVCGGKKLRNPTKEELENFKLKNKLKSE